MSFEDDEGLIGAGYDGLGDSDEPFLLVKDAQTRWLGLASVEHSGSALGRFAAAWLDLRERNLKTRAVAHAVLDDGQHGNARQIRQETLQRQDPIGGFTGAHGGFEISEADGLVEGELADGGANDFGEMRAAAELRAHLVREGTNVGTGGALDGKARERACDLEQAKFKHLDLDGLELDGLVLARELVRGTAVNLFGRKRGRGLQKAAGQAGGEALKLFGIERRSGIGTECGAVGVIRIRGETEAERGFVTLAPAGIELCEARGASQEQHQDASGQWIERAEMADLAKSEQAADGVDDVMGGAAAGLIDHQRAIESNGTRVA